MTEETESIEAEDVRVLRELKKRIDSNVCISKAYVFGSVVKSLLLGSEFRKESDIDIQIIENPKCPIYTKERFNEDIGMINGHKPDVGVFHMDPEDEKSLHWFFSHARKQKPIILLK